MEDKILCNVSDLEPIADAVREKENTNKLYSVEELKVKVPELISSSGEEAEIETCTVTITFISSESRTIFYSKKDDKGNIEHVHQTVTSNPFTFEAVCKTMLVLDDLKREYVNYCSGANVFYNNGYKSGCTLTAEANGIVNINTKMASSGAE